jgi:GT2 family glycosyltransferase
MIHRDVYEELGGWDTEFFLDYEDVDLGIRAWQANWDSVTVPQAKVYHAVNASNAKVIPNLRQLVKRRRYISGRASLSIIALKTFSTSRLYWPAVAWCVVLLANLARMRWRMAWCDLLAGLEAASRAGEAHRFRAAARPLRKARPGELFFKLPEFNH